MAAILQITLTIDGQAGPFDLFSDVDNYAVAFDTQVSAAAMVAGYQVEAPDGTTNVKVCSTGTCENCVILPANCPTTTTTTSSSTSTTTSTSSSTTTSTTTVQQVMIKWELTTNTPGSLLDTFPQSSILNIAVDGVSQVNAGIAGSVNIVSGNFNINVGSVLTATIETDRVGEYTFTHQISKDGSFYQPADVCSFCIDSFTTALSPAYTENGANPAVDLTFIASTRKETTTTTTSSTSSSTTTTSTTPVPTTTTTSTTCDCSLNGGSAVVVAGTTTTTTTKIPIPTTTSTTTQFLFNALISQQSSATQNAGICNYSLDNFIFKNGVTADAAVGDILYISPTSGATFNGGGNWWHYKGNTTSAGNTQYIEVNSSGEVISEFPCFA
tara:strand:- start:12752 stop:13903 length:1152 start_codon:yes stop_codon:yes gene_type:complete